uniref:Uncharacterized protein n=1 Tax=Caenorhabditis tropicalis TaxID=1561998 RepID=A0A1I7U1X7_9PELO
MSSTNNQNYRTESQQGESSGEYNIYTRGNHVREGGKRGNHNDQLSRSFGGFRRDNVAQSNNRNHNQSMNQNYQSNQPPRFDASRDQNYRRNQERYLSSRNNRSFNPRYQRDQINQQNDGRQSPMRYSRSPSPQREQRNDYGRNYGSSSPRFEDEHFNQFRNRRDSPIRYSRSPSPQLEHHQDNYRRNYRPSSPEFGNNQSGRNWNERESPIRYSRSPSPQREQQNSYGRDYKSSSPESGNNQYGRNWNERKSPIRNARSPSPQREQYQPMSLHGQSRSTQLNGTNEYGTSQFFGRNEIGVSKSHRSKVYYLADKIPREKFDSSEPISPIEFDEAIRRELIQDKQQKAERMAHDREQANMREERKNENRAFVIGRGRRIYFINRGARNNLQMPERPLVERLDVVHNRNWMDGVMNEVEDPSNHFDVPQNDIIPRPRRICKESDVNEHIRNPCLFCEGPHKADECCVVVEVSERRNHINRHGRCIRCFQKHHVTNCHQLNAFFCPYCNDTSSDLHHLALCENAYPVYS